MVNEREQEKTSKTANKKNAAEKKDIKIFVSRRIDLDSAVVDNPLYVPVRCGAVFDKSDSKFLGDNTGENISEKRMSYCELTVIYWMWKNAKADYYGLSHYRRYLSFADEKIPGAWQEQGFLDSMTEANLEKAGLLDEEKIRECIEENDMIIPVEFAVNTVFTPHGTGYTDTYDYVVHAWEDLFIKQEDIDNMMKIIDEDFPEYSQSAKKFMKGKTFRGFNIFILKKELFHSLCEFEFGVLEKIDPMIDYTNASDSRKRAPGYLGEVLYSIWCYHQMQKKDLKVSERQIIFFQDTASDKPVAASESDDVVTVCYPCKYDELPLVGVSLQSVLDHISDDKKYRFIFLLKNMPENKFFVMEQNRQKANLMKIAKPYDNVEVEFYDPKVGLGPKDAREYFEPDMEMEYYAILMPWILKNVKKVVYLTQFTNLKADIAELFEQDMKDGAILAAKDLLAIGNVNGYDPNIRKHLKKNVKMKDLHRYIDNTVMVMDLEELRQRHDVEELYEKLESKAWEKISIAHDAFNLYYEDDVEILPLKWNLMNRSTPQILQCVDFVESDLVKEFGAVKEPKLINFKNIPTPWHNTNCDFSYDFWEVARRTPFYEQIMSYQLIGPNTAIWDMQVRSGLYDPRTKLRKLYDRLCPPNSGRQKLVEWLLPKGSGRREAVKSLFWMLKGRRKPVVEPDDDEDTAEEEKKTDSEESKKETALSGKK